MSLIHYGIMSLIHCYYSDDPSIHLWKLHHIHKFAHKSYKLVRYIHHKP